MLGSAQLTDGTPAARDASDPRPRVELTDEQRAVVEARDRLIKVNAVAGSGKTTTLLAFAEHRPRARILYLAYNRAVADEVRQKALLRGVKNLVVNTVHGLAFRYANGASYTLEPDLSEYRLLEQYVPAGLLGRERASRYAWLLKDLINYYLNAGLTRLDFELLAQYTVATTPSEPLRELLTTRGSEVIEKVRSVLSDMRNHRVPAVHDFYLKMFQFGKVRLPFDVILVDEAQDTSGVMLSVISRQDHAQRVFVGDEFQQIYSFRHAVNSLSQFKGSGYGLTQTFRFGENLARHLSRMINDAYALIGEPRGLTIRGTGLPTRFSPKTADGPYPLTVIGRSNLLLFEAVLERLIEGAKALHFEGGYPGYAFLNPRVVALLRLKEGKHVDDPLIRQLGSFDEAKRYAKDTQNAGLSIMIDLVARYGSKLFDFDRTIKKRLVEKPQAKLLFTTTHKAKGQEYAHVAMIDDDFITRGDLAKQVKSEGDEVNTLRLKEEINIYYVAATRAKESIKLATF